MKNERLSQYRRKINFITDKLNSLPKRTKDPIIVDGVLHRVEVSIEAVNDLVAMLVKDLGKDVGDDYHNLNFLEEKKIVFPQLNAVLKRLTGLRNAIVHRYNQFEEKEVINNLDKITKTIFTFLEKVENEAKKL